MRLRLAFALFALTLLPGVAPVHAGPRIEHWRTDAGARVYFVPARELPIVDVRVVFDAGSARDGEHAGLARLTNHLLEEATTTRSAQDLFDRLAVLGAKISTDVDRDMAWVNLRSLSDPRRLDPAVELLAEVLGRPALAPAAVARERARQGVRIEERAQALDARLTDRLYAEIYRGHPYATPVLGTAASVAALDASVVSAFHDRYYVARNAVVAIVGDVDRAAAERLVARALALLPAGEVAPPLPAEPAAPAEPDVVHDALPSSQTHIGLGQVGMRVGDPDYFALYVANHVLGGGGFVSRLFDEIREKRGLSYDVSSYFEPLRVAGPFSVALATRNDQAQAAQVAARATIAAFIDDGPTAQEVERSKQNIIGGFPLRIDNNAKKLQYVAFIGFYELPLDYLDTFAARIAEVTPARAHAAFRARVRPDRFVTVIVGGGN
ncbi:MAG: insulinase family protein [Gammaproteobacteria bacterium]|nr:insulinase family protein [Gammaproteobacteria bacterium]